MPGEINLSRKLKELCFRHITLLDQNCSKLKLSNFVKYKMLIEHEEEMSSEFSKRE